MNSFFAFIKAKVPCVSQLNFPFSTDAFFVSENPDESFKTKIDILRFPKKKKHIKKVVLNQQGV